MCFQNLDSLFSQDDGSDTTFRFGHGKIKSALFSFRHGMQMLPYYLSRRLEKNLRLSTPIEDLTFSDGKIRLYSQGESWSFDKVITTLPAYQNTTLLTGVHDELIRNLKDIEYAPLAIVSLGFGRKVNPYRGFGYLVPHQEREMILGAVWNDQTFREHSDNNSSSMTVMIGGAFFQKFGSFSEDDFIRIAMDATQRHLGINDNPVVKMCRILPRAIPQYNVGHADKIKAIKQRSPFGLTFFGNFMGGMSISDIVSSAKDLTETHQKVYDIVREA
ncbi:protoporphyrinogen oxidase [PVC group bacterium]|nr:protoporphyrinogen oxidase [PVC group bacterium]